MARDTGNVLLLCASLRSLSCGEDNGSSPSEPGNNRPQIQTITVTPNAISSGSTTWISCIAVDADGDSLVHYWSCVSGFLVGEDSHGSDVEWYARIPGIPQEDLPAGFYWVRVDVSDGKAIDTDSVSVEVQ